MAITGCGIELDNSVNGVGATADTDRRSLETVWVFPEMRVLELGWVGSELEDWVDEEGASCSETGEGTAEAVGRRPRDRS